jgi:hypothetical protein
MSRYSRADRSVRIWRKHGFLLASVSCLLLAFGMPLFSQVNTGRILGTITDQSGGTVGGTTVTVTNTQTGVARTLTTEQAGEYVAPNLIPGAYTVRASASGFQTFERQNITVGLGQDARVDAQLTPGLVTQTVEVTETVPMLDTTSGVVSGTVNTETIVDLPLKARNYQDFLVLRPGVVQSPGGGTLTTSVHGLAPSQNNNFIEGLDSNDPITGQNITNTTLPLGDAATILPIDAIQEVNIETNAPAEFGRRPGAVINVGLKSGTNSIHGSAFAYGRDSAWNATDFVNPPAPKQPMNLEQWGGTVGGPIVKNKVFYFTAFERQTYTVGNAFSLNTPSSNPSASATNGIPAAEAALAAANIPLSPLSVSLLPYYSNNNLNPNNNLTSAITFGFPTSFTVNNVVGKIDYHLNDHHAFSGAYFYGKGNAVGEDTGYTAQVFDIVGSLQAEFLTTSWTWTPNSIWLNDLRFGWNHYLRNTQTGDYKTPASTYGMVTGVTDPQLLGFPTITINGFSNLGGSNRSPRNFGPGNDYDVVDHASYFRGKHAFKFGGEILYLHTFFDQIPNGRGTFNFGNAPPANPIGANITPLEAFLAGLPDTSNGATILEGSPARTYTQKVYSIFFSDSWRATSRLTVNLGLRYEYFTPLKEINNLIGNFDPTAGLEQVGQNGLKSAYNAYARDISPRFGVAWDVTGKGTTVVRAGGGVYYDNAISGQFIGLQGNLPASQIGIQAIPTGSVLYLPNGSTIGPIVPNGGGMATQTVAILGSSVNWTLNGAGGPMLPAFSPTNLKCGNGLAASAAPGGAAPGVAAGFTNPSPCSIFATSPNLASPMILSWNLGVQHALNSTVAVEVNYIGNHGMRLPGVIDLNQPANSSGGKQNLLPYYSQYPYLQYLDYMQNNEWSNYNALEATLTARNFHRLSFLAGYTFSHALTEEPQTGYSLQTAQDPSNIRGDFGPTNFDLRHNFTFSPSYALPSIKSPLQLLEGWTLQSAIQIHTGFAWTATTSSNVSGTNEKKDRWDFFGNSSDFQQGPNPIPFFPGKTAANIAAMPSACLQAANSIGTTNTTLSSGCFFQGSSVLIAPPTNTFGTEARGMFRGPNYANWDFSVFKNTKIKEWLNTQFRAEFFNVNNHPIFATGSGSVSSSTFGCACQSPDQANTNPVLGTGGARTIQLGLKLMF